MHFKVRMETIQSKLDDTQPDSVFAFALMSSGFKAEFTHGLVGGLLDEINEDSDVGKLLLYLSLLANYGDSDNPSNPPLLAEKYCLKFMDPE
jgi:hypothetical protein